MHSAEGLRLQAFNQKLQEELNPLVIEIASHDKRKQHRLLALKTSRFKKYVLAIPAFIGWLFHLPLYAPVQKLVFRKTAHNDHYDSVLAAVLLITYPCYLILVTYIVYFITGSAITWFLLFLLPFSAWAFVQLKPQIDK